MTEQKSMQERVNYARHNRVWQGARWLHQWPNWRWQLGLGIHCVMAIYNLPQGLTVVLDVGVVLRLGRLMAPAGKGPGAIRQWAKATQWAVQVDWADIARVRRPAPMRGRQHGRE